MTEEIKAKLEKVGMAVPKILLPKDSVDLNKWAVVACDQFTSEPEYWEKVEEYVDEAPSTLKIIFPEVYLEMDPPTAAQSGRAGRIEKINETMMNPPTAAQSGRAGRIEKINETMKEYLESGTLEEKFEGLVLVERELKNKNPSSQKAATRRRGLVVALDLEKYDFHKGSKTLIRATEGTVESRIPPRLEIRKNALVELPHIMVLIDDPSKTVVEPLFNGLGQAKPLLYDFDLMMGGGHIKGWKITDETTIGQIADNLERLISNDGFLFAMGDGNHSLATAKTHWNNLKETLTEEEKVNHPARYALVELVNVHDDGLEFEPIHRILVNSNQLRVDSKKIREYLEGEGEEIGIVTNEGVEKIKIKNMGSNLAVGNLQILLDKYIEENPETKIDYIHGEEAVVKLVREKNGVGFLLPGMKKEELFPTVEKDGALPRKTFSMGEAEEKRYYLEARKIVL